MEEMKKKLERMVLKKKANLCLPEELVNEILLRLPVKSILRFKSASKTWYHHFKNPTFISKHHSLSKRNTHLLVHHSDSNGGCGGDDHGRPNTLTIFHAEAETLVPYHGLLPQLPHHVVDSNGFGPHLNFCADNGLVCIYDRWGHITIWNPATSEFRILPICTCTNSNLPKNVQINPLSNSVRVGFGLDPTSNDYKVIITLQYGTGVYYKNDCAIYNMSTDSWRAMCEEEAEMLTNIHIDPKLSATAVCLNGTCYWKAVDYSNPGFPVEKLLAFHFGNETFQLIRVPPQIIKGVLPSFANDGVYILPVNIDIMGLSGENTDAIWMLNVEGGHCTKQFILEHVPKRAIVLMVWSETKLLVRLKGSGALLLWDIDAKRYTDGGNACRHVFRVCPYEESLVSVRRG